MKKMLQAAALSLVMLTSGVSAAQKRAVPGFFVARELRTLKPYNQLSQDEQRDLLRTAMFSKEPVGRGEAIKKLEGNFSKEAIQKIKDLNGGGAWILKTALYNSQTPKMIANIKNATAANKADLALIANFSGQANTREEARKKLEQFKGSKINWPAEVRAEQNKYIGQLLQPRGAKAEITEEKVKQIKEDIGKGDFSAEEEFSDEELKALQGVLGWSDEELAEFEQEEGTGQEGASFEELSAQAWERLNKYIETHIVKVIKENQGFSGEQQQSFQNRIAGLKDSLTQALADIAKEPELNKQEAINTFFKDQFDPSLKALEADIAQAVAAAAEGAGQEEEAAEEEKAEASSSVSAEKAAMMKELKSALIVEYTGAGDNALWGKASDLIRRNAMNLGDSAQQYQQRFRDFHEQLKQAANEGNEQAFNQALAEAKDLYTQIQGEVQARQEAEQEAAERKAQEEEAAKAEAERKAQEEEAIAEQKARGKAAAQEAAAKAAQKAQEEAAQAASSSQQQAALISEFSTFTIPGNPNKKASNNITPIDKGATINLDNLELIASKDMQRLGSWQKAGFFGGSNFVPATAEEIERLNVLAKSITAALQGRSADDVKALHQEFQKLINWGSAINLSDHSYRAEGGTFAFGKGQESDERPFGLSNDEIMQFTLDLDNSFAPRDAWNFIAPKILEEVLKNYSERLNWK